jgi:hypothetical protein
VPTPFYHLDIAKSLLNHPALPNSTRRSLLNYRSAFLLGNTAPDVQVLSRQKRQATHFFSFPFNPKATPPWESILAVYPVLTPRPHSSAEQTAFLAGYLCHLQADWYWIRDIFLPAFGPDLAWGTFSERLYLHNVLRAYLDQQVLAGLPVEIHRLLQNAQPDHWLPFTADHFLVDWRDYIAKQLEPGARIETVEVFAARQGLSPEEFQRLLESEDHMENQVFIHISRNQIREYRERLVQSNLSLITGYLSGIRFNLSGPTTSRESFV